MELRTWGSGKCASSPWRSQRLPMRPSKGGRLYWLIGVLDVGDELRALVHQVTAPAQQIAGRAHLGRVDIGLRQHPASEQPGDLVGVDLVVLGLAPVDGPHVQGVPEHEGNALARAHIGHPVPGEHALDRHHQVVAERLHRGQEGLRGALQVAREAHLAGRIQDAHVHLAGVQVDAAVVFVLTGIEFHLRPPFRLVSDDTLRMVDRICQARRKRRPPPLRAAAGPGRAIAPLRSPCLRAAARRRLVRVKGGRSPAQRTLEARQPARTLPHGRMRRTLASGHEDQSGARRGTQAATERALDRRDQLVPRSPSVRPATLGRVQSIFLRWWIEVTKPGKTRGLVSVSRQSTGPPNSGAALAVGRQVIAGVGPHGNHCRGGHFLEAAPAAKE